ncbi:HutD family protein [Kitasatospora sp. NBC_01539]|uniref:HutD/Ves family protein n=1 Tax=Kitasatospora sp. NBC_01539 TaxID=2903577 RepID=UPI0038603213
MAWQVLRADGRAAVPWLNGGGVTREVAGGPAGSGPADFDWRVSLADVAQSGPFSVFPGVDRVITVVAGEALELAVGGTAPVRVGPHQPFAFPGDAPTGGRLPGGPVVALNVMTRRGRASARVVVAGGPGPLEVPDGGTLMVVCLAGTVAVGTTGPLLARHDAAVCEDAAPGGGELLQVLDGLAAVVTIRRSPSAPA